MYTHSNQNSKKIFFQGNVLIQLFHLPQKYRNNWALEVIFHKFQAYSFSRSMHQYFGNGGALHHGKPIYDETTV